MKSSTDKDVYFKTRVWKLIASEFKDEKNVIGYNIINEPWAGNVFKVFLLG